jgi:hypothetical protein
VPTREENGIIPSFDNKQLQGACLADAVFLFPVPYYQVITPFFLRSSFLLFALPGRPGKGRKVHEAVSLFNKEGVVIVILLAAI